MRKFSSGVFVCLAAIFLFPGLLFADEHKVAVHVEAKEKSIRNLVASYISRELRSIPDVRVVEHSPAWEIFIAIHEPKTNHGEKLGLFFSVVIIQPFVFDALLIDMLPENRKDVGLLLTKNLSEFHAHRILTGSWDDIPNICSRIVASFDQDQLEYVRKAREELSKRKKKW